ncbi:MAG: SMC-Scp complex subunit ScpB [Deltaproteobacteria bacterium]|nr:SMC-Scp complex subunit ScpB [Deltaproteobacteria bacterium]
MEHTELKKVIESLLFASGRPLTAKEIQAVFDEEISGGVIHEVLDSLKKEYEEQGRGFGLEEISGGYQLRTKPEFAAWVQKLEQRRPPRLSSPALESLAIIAYRQPVTRPEVEHIRGVDSGAVLKGLLERRFIRVVGKKDEPGRPLIYATTPEFLALFGLRDLSDMPSLKDFEEKAAAENAAAAEEREEKGEGLFEDTAEMALRLADLGDEEREALDLLEKGLQELKEVEKGLEPAGGTPSGGTPLDKAEGNP